MLRFLDCRVWSNPDHTKRILFIEKYNLIRKVINRITLNQKELEQFGSDDQKLEDFLIKGLKLKNEDFFIEKHKETVRPIGEKTIHCLNSNSRILIRVYYNEIDETLLIQDNTIKRNLWKIQTHNLESKSKDSLFKEIIHDIIWAAEYGFYVPKVYEHTNISEEHIYKILSERQKESQLQGRKMTSLASVLSTKNGIFLRNSRINSNSNKIQQNPATETLQQIVIINKNENIAVQEFKMLQMTIIDEENGLWGIDGNLLRKITLIREELLGICKGERKS